MKKKNKNKKNKHKNNAYNANNENNSKQSVNNMYINNYYDRLLKQLFFNEMIGKPIVNIFVSRQLQSSTIKLCVPCCFQLGVIGIQKKDCKLTNIFEFLNIINEWKNNKNIQTGNSLSDCLAYGNIFKSKITQLYSNGFNFRMPNMSDWQKHDLGKNCDKNLIGCCISCYIDAKHIKNDSKRNKLYKSDESNDVLMYMDVGFSMYPSKINVKNYNKNLDTTKLFGKDSHRTIRESVKLILKFDYSQTQLSFYLNDMQTPLILKRGKAQYFEKHYDVKTDDNIINLNKNYYYIPWLASCSYDNWKFQTQIQVVYPQQNNKKNQTN